MSREGLKRLFEVNHYAIGANARDLTHEESLIEPRPGANCANWVLGHIVQNRGAVLEMLGEKPVWNQAEGEPYKRGSKPVTGTTAKPFAQLFEALDLSQERLVAGFSRAKDGDLGSPDAKDSVFAKLAFLQFHEAYHAGQLGLLRRVAGKKGAIP